MQQGNSIIRVCIPKASRVLPKPFEKAHIHATNPAKTAKNPPYFATSIGN